MNITLHGLGTANPEHCMPQSDALQMFTDIVCETERQSRLARVLFRKSNVLTRRTCVPHTVAYNWCQTDDSAPETPRDLAIPPPELPEVDSGASPGPTTQERMGLYARFAIGMAEASAREALENARVKPETVTHLVVVTCTGFDAPGVDIELIHRLNLPLTTQRVNVGFMGCHGAINGLRAAQAIAAADSNARVLLCAVEACSLHYRFQWDDEGVIGNALFADGSASLVLSQASVDGNGDTAAWRLETTGSSLIPKSREAMSWRVGDHGFEMQLTSEVADYIERGFGDWLHDWLAQQGLGRDDIGYWGVHPGGPRILDAVQTALDLEANWLDTSRSILSQYGNMSSPTVLFILQQFMQERSSGAGKHCLLLAFGPGLAAEVALLRAP